MQDIGFRRKTSGLQILVLRTVNEDIHLRIDESVNVSIEKSKYKKQQKRTGKEYDGEKLLNQSKVA